MVAILLCMRHNATLKVEVWRCIMFLNENQVRNLTSKFMPRLKEESITAMIDVACNGLSILASAQKHKLTHQSLSKNLINLKELQNKIINTDLFPSSYLLKENAHALLVAEVSFSESEEILCSMCLKLGGKVERSQQNSEVKLYLNGTLTTIFLNPNKSYEREWSYDYCDL